VVYKNLEKWSQVFSEIKISSKVYGYLGKNVQEKLALPQNYGF